MNSEQLIARIRKAINGNSIRNVAKLCEVSHEQIRKLVIAKKAPNMTLETFNKIDEGLKRNGF